MKKVIIVTVILLLASCNDKIAGTLGSGSIYEFKCSEEKLNICLNKFKESSKHLAIPEKWKKYDNWDEIGYGFLEGKVFYLKGNKDFEEEMYYVTVLGSSPKLKNIASISIRSVFRITEGTPRWLYLDDLSKSEAKEIEDRFQKIILNKMIKSDCNCNTYIIKLKRY
ncbi:hypothetical protein [Flavobacterium sp. ov086]|uniref:hypothetical protein n=1 Tax=Flavobacterium sp. ov086 TaxID=1761785 RepID=UPI000B63631C|nr:hypothetical protein [Flavobacterium sp. ov086]SNS04899.1 hypothetical protein SAMN04487979_1562 [Flavobacterium sp. ov086]